MGDDLVQAVAGLVEWFVAQTASNEPLRARIHALAEAVAAATDRPAAAAPPVEVASSAPGPEPAPSSESSPGRPESPAPNASSLPPRPAATGPTGSPPPTSAAPEPLRELTFHRPRGGPLEPVAPGQAPRASDPADPLPAIEARARLKAAGVRWAVERLRRREAGLDFAEGDRAILDEGGRLGCFLWMNSPDFVVPRDPAEVEALAGSFEALAAAVALVRLALPAHEARREPLEPAFDLLAEAQSALRVATQRAQQGQDADQFAAYDCLRAATHRERIYVHRHMRLDDPANPALATDLQARIGAAATRYRAVLGTAKRREDLLKKLRWHARRLNAHDEGDENWPRIVAAVDALVTEEGLPPSSVELREVLLPLFDDLPDGDEPPGFRLARSRVAEYRDAHEPTPEDAPTEAPTAEVAEVAGWLRGRSVVLIGGTRRPGSAEQIEAAFGLSELVWVSTREHESIDKFEPVVARPEVALVLLAIRWSSHSFGEVKRFCDRSGKPLVRLPRGYGVNQIAAEAVHQVSHQFARADDPPCPE